MKFLALFLFSTTLLAQSPINVETVRADLLSKSHVVPEDVIKSLKPGLFKVMYAGDLCFVHIPYKSYAGEAFMQSSDMIVYRQSEKKWIYENLVQTWYNVDLIDSAQLIFVADVNFCETTGECNTYKSVSQFDGRSMVVFREYTGFDKNVYYNRLLTLKKTDEVKSAIGKTISDLYTLTDFRVEQRQTSFTLKHKAAAIVAVTNDEIVKRTLIDKSERVIVNH